jgi:hypothetical protein
MATTARQIHWQHQLDEALRQAQGKLVLLDFSAAPM